MMFLRIPVIVGFFLVIPSIKSQPQNLRRAAEFDDVDNSVINYATNTISSRGNSIVDVDINTLSSPTSNTGAAGKDKQDEEKDCTGKVVDVINEAYATVFKWKGKITELLKEIEGKLQNKQSCDVENFFEYQETLNSYFKIVVLSDEVKKSIKYVIDCKEELSEFYSPEWYDFFADKTNALINTSQHLKKAIQFGILFVHALLKKK